VSAQQPDTKPHMFRVGKNRICTWPYFWWFSCQNCRVYAVHIYTVHVNGSGQPYTCSSHVHVTCTCNTAYAGVQPDTRPRWFGARAVASFSDIYFNPTRHVHSYLCSCPIEHAPTLMCCKVNICLTSFPLPITSRAFLTAQLSNQTPTVMSCKVSVLHPFLYQSRHVHS